MAGTVSGGAPRAHRHEHLIRCPETPSVERGPERLRGGLPVSGAASVRRCTRPSVGQSLREQGGRRSAADWRPPGRREQRGDEALKDAPERGYGPVDGCGTRPVQRYRCCRRAVAVALRAHRRSAEGRSLVPLGGAGIEAWKSAHLFNQIVSLLPRNRLFLGGSHASELRKKADSGEE